jgi:hypothetical protein
MLPSVRRFPNVSTKKQSAKFERNNRAIAFSYGGASQSRCFLLTVTAEDVEAAVRLHRGRHLRMTQAMPHRLVSATEPSSGVRRAIEQFELRLQDLNALRSFGLGEPRAPVAPEL